jgi:hypothetical protein
MKNNVLVIAGLAVLSTSAFASKARMEALGQGTVSNYVLDTRSVFLNPASVNELKNYVVTEWGSASTSDDSATAPKAEGGFFREQGSFSYGFYLGNNGLDHGRTSTSPALLRQDNALDFFLGGDIGVKWGAKLHFAQGKDQTTSSTVTSKDSKNTALGLGLGAIMGNASVYANVDLMDKSTNSQTSSSSVTTSSEWKQKPSYQVGGSYALMGYTLFADVKNGKADASTTASNVTSSSTQKWMSYEVGAGRIHEINPTSRLYTSLSYYADSNYNISGYSTYTLPASIGLEADATSWLTLRGSVKQNFVYGYKRALGSDKHTSISNSTEVNGGATLNFGKLKIDGVIGNTAASRAGTTGTKNGVLTTDNLLTRVAVNYNF